MWKIYYSDHSTFSNEDGEPWEAPSVDVQILQQEDELVFYHDYYLFRDDLKKWIPCNGADGLLDQLMCSARFITACVNGRYLERSEWEKLLHKIHREAPLSAHNASQFERRGVDF